MGRSANAMSSKAPSGERTALAQRRSRKPARDLSTTQPTQTLTEKAYRLIEERIVTLQLRPGEIVSEQGLSATIKIGRTPIREALQRLARESLITILPRKGIIVTDPNPPTQLPAMEVPRPLGPL